MERRVPTLIGIDGTGTEWFARDRDEYAADFSESHVRYLCDHWPGKAAYMEGPKVFGLGTDALAQRAAVHARSSDCPNGLVFAGFSRGGAAAIVAAQLVRKFDLPVHCLVLFDAVDRSLAIGDTTVPANVHNVIYAKRDPAAGSRESFGNVGERMESRATRVKVRTFMGTHGAIGGTPWVKPKPVTLRGPNAHTGLALNRGPRRIDEGSIDMMTNVTYAQDRQAASEVLRWVRKTLGEVVPTCTPLRYQRHKARTY